MSSSAFHRDRDRRVKWKGGKDPEVSRIHRGLYIHPFSQPNCLPSNPQGKSTDIPLLSPFVVHHTHSFISTYHLIESICEIYLIIYAKKDANANNSWVDCRQTIFIPGPFQEPSHHHLWMREEDGKGLQDKPSDKFNLDLISTPQPIWTVLRPIKLWRGYSVYCVCRGRTLSSSLPFLLGDIIIRREPLWQSESMNPLI